MPDNAIQNAMCELTTWVCSGNPSNQPALSTQSGRANELEEPWHR